MLGWGFLPWGLGPFGSIVALTIDSVIARDTRTVRVTFSTAPLAQVVTQTGDALNPATWTIVRTDTGQVFTVLQIERVSSTVYDIRTLEDFGEYRINHTISSLTLRSAGGVLLSPPYTRTFAGVAASVQAATTPQDTTDTKSVNGVFEVLPGGDYAQQLNDDVVRKVIMRRLSVNPGAFFHLPNFGLGVKVKSPLPTTDLVKLKKEIERQVLNDPSVLQAEVRLSLDASGTLLISVKAKTRLGFIDLTVPSPLTTG